MPIYEYRCTNGHTFETMQSINDDALEACEVCEAPAERIMSPVAVHFKGSGFYATDYGRKGQKSGSESSKESSGSSGDAKKSDSKSDSGKSDSKSKKKD